MLVKFKYVTDLLSPPSSVGSEEVSRTGSRWFERIHSSLIAVHCFAMVCGKKANGFERVLCGILVKRIQESLDRCTGSRDITQISL